VARLKLKLQLYCGSEIAMGPGKAVLLQAIGRTGSISAAGRALGMSYRRAWLLVDTMNRCFGKPLVEAQSG
jgi:molybdate transport system regulatory protein